jgi:hypothetical protein
VTGPRASGGAQGSILIDGGKTFCCVLTSEEPTVASIEGWSHAYAERVRELSRKIAASTDEGLSAMRDAAARTGGLPVYCDLGGCLIITPEGTVVQLEYSFDTVSTVTDPSWLRAARVAAAKTHPELEGLQPGGARICAACAGTGRIRQARGLRCGVCYGIGFVDDVVNTE